MKRITLSILMFLAVLSYGQQSFNVYIPMKTYHWDRNPYMLNKYHPTEGGNAGMVLSMKINNKRIFTELQGGIIKNSFHDVSVITQIAVGTEYKHFEALLCLGVASGYHKAFEGSERAKMLPDIMVSNGIMPTTMISLRYSKYFVKPTVNISPIFINFGLSFPL
jgi:hypothetical protein